MHCRDCDVNLSDDESTRWNEQTKDYWDLCNTCLSNFYKDTDNGNSYFDTTDDVLSLEFLGEENGDGG